MAGEKEFNGILFDQLDIVEDALKIAKSENASATIAFLENKIAQIKRKLYQDPPLISPNP